MRKMRSNCERYIIPVHYRNNVTMNDFYANDKKYVKVPAAPAGLSPADRGKIEKMAHSAIKRGWRPKAEYYPVPEWINRSKKRKEYFLARLQMEIRLREGYRCQQLGHAK